MRKRPSVSTVRAVCLAAVFGVFLAGMLFPSGFGTLSSFGIGDIAAICPVGSLEILLSTRTLIPQAVISLLVMVVLSLALGKFFCGWVCPVPPLRRALTSRTRKAEERAERREAAKAHIACAGCATGCAASRMASALAGMGEGEGAGADDPAGSPEEATPAAGGIGLDALDTSASVGPRKRGFDSRFLVLGVALVSALAFGFPVFCLLCPVGLIFATLVAVGQLVFTGKATFSLIVFPLILVVELVVLRKWCVNLCPLGAVISLVSTGGGRLLRPRLDRQKCLRSGGDAGCVRCMEACPEEIDLFHVEQGRSIRECRKCHLCADSCPAGAISFPLFMSELDKMGASPHDEQGPSKQTSSVGERELRGDA